MTLTLHDDLPAILESLQAEPGLEALEERVLEAGHLEEDDYGLLLEKRVRGAAHSNLRHHILFCELCATEFLRRLAPVAEAEFLAAALRKKRRRRFYTIIFAVVATVAMIAVWIASRGLDDNATSEQEATFRATLIKGTFAVPSAWAGTGPRIEGAEGLAPDRLYLRLWTELAPKGGVWAYPFHVAGGVVTPLTPLQIKISPDRPAGTPEPPEGLKDPGGQGAAQLLVIVSTRSMSTMRTSGDRGSFALTIQRHLAAGHALTTVPTQFTRDRGAHHTRVVLIDIER